MREGSLKTSAAAPAINLVVTDGLDPSLDAAADAADPRHLFLRRAWFAAAGGADLRTVTARRPDGRIIAAIPTARAAIAIRAVPGCYWPFRSFPVARDADDAEIAALLRHQAARRALGPIWRIGPVYEDDPTAARLIALAGRSGWTVARRRIATTYMLDIETLRREGSWPRTSTLRKNRWFEKELAKDGTVDQHSVSGGEWTAAVFDALAGIEARSWIPERTGGGDAKFLAPHHRHFWEKAAADPALGAMIRAAILTIGGEPAAFAFDLDVGTLRYAIANSYDRRFAKNSPGRVLAYRSLAAAVERGVTRVDWGAGDSGYKRTMGALPGPEIVDLLLVRGTLSGRLVAPLWTRSGR